MEGSATFTIETSSTTMNCATHTSARTTPSGACFCCVPVFGEWLPSVTSPSLERPHDGIGSAALPVVSLARSAQGLISRSLDVGMHSGWLWAVPQPLGEHDDDEI